MNSLEEINFLAPETIQDPIGANSLARQYAPIYRVPQMDKTYMVFSYEHILEINSQPLLFSSKSSSPLLGKSLENPLCMEIYDKGWPQSATLLTNDPPSHDRFRKLVNTAFTFAKVKKMESTMEAISHKLVDSFIADKGCEFISQFAVPMPVKMIGDQLGIPENEHFLVKEWSDAFVDLLGSMRTDEEDIANAKRVVEFQHKMKFYHDERLITPTNDMLSDLANAKTDDGISLTTAELLNVSQQLVVAGNETTSNLLSGGLLLLLKNPEQMEIVKADRTLIPNMIEEMLRLESPSNTMWRTSTADTEINGVKIPKGSTVLLRYGSANRDETVFENPNQFNVQRKFIKKHLAFGHGIHTCIGAMLARKESAVAFNVILDRLSNIRLDEEKNDLKRLPNLLLRGLEKLYINFD
ncbi:MAG: cytochrome P450 [Colwellia sp.]|nr:cytochrome P450 [Colwellia sp.]